MKQNENETNFPTSHFVYIHFACCQVNCQPTLAWPLTSECNYILWLFFHVSPSNSPAAAARCSSEACWAPWWPRRKSRGGALLLGQRTFWSRRGCLRHWPGEMNDEQEEDEEGGGGACFVYPPTPPLSGPLRKKSDVGDGGGFLFCGSVGGSMVRRGLFFTCLEVEALVLVFHRCIEKANLHIIVNLEMETTRDNWVS